MSILRAGDDVLETSFIKESERDGTPANDADRVVRVESDGKLAPYYTRNGEVLNCGETINGATLPVPVYQNDSDNELYACDANDTSKMKFIGFVTTNGTDGNPARFQGAGVIDGFSGLAEGEKYYVQDTAGTIGTTAGTNEVLVGVAISTTQLLIQKGCRHSSGTFTFTDTGGTEVVTSGFRPSVIRIFAKNSESTGTRAAQLTAIWVNGTLNSINSFWDGTEGGAEANGRIYYDKTNGHYMTFTITGVTDTGFTITYTETNSYNMPTAVVWEAEGEL